MDKFRQFFRGKRSDDRSNHFIWNQGDLEVTKKVEQPEKADRSNHFTWKAGDLEIHKSPLQALRLLRIKKSLSEEGEAGSPFDVKIHPHLQDLPLEHEVTTDFADIHPDMLDDHLNHTHSYVSHDEWLPRRGPDEVPNHFKWEAHSMYKNISRRFNDPLRNPQRHDEYGINMSQLKHHSIQPVFPRKELFDHLDEITRLKTMHPMRLFRGFGNFDAASHAPGSEFTDHGYSGLSRNFNLSGGFAGSATTGRGFMNTVGVIHVPAGSRGHLLDHPSKDSPFSDEDEFLLHRGTRFRVDRHSVLGERAPVHLVHMTVLGHEPKPLHSFEKIGE